MRLRRQDQLPWRPPVRRHPAGGRAAAAASRGTMTMRRRGWPAGWGQTLTAGGGGLSAPAARSWGARRRRRPGGGLSRRILPGRLAGDGARWESLGGELGGVAARRWLPSGATGGRSAGQLGRSAGFGDEVLAGLVDHGGA